jgi:hypothetical protein
MAAGFQSNIISRWSTLIENLQASPMEFYASVEKAIEKRQVPGASTSRVDWHEGGPLSAKREYLRVSREKLVFDICGAPFGTGFFVSSWLSEAPFRFEIWQIIAGIIVAAILGRIAGFFLFLFVLAAIFIVFRSIASRGSQDLNLKILGIPIIGPIYEILFRPITYYKLDTESMFQQAIHNSVMEVVDEITKAKGLRLLSELERKPILKEFFQR